MNDLPKQTAPLDDDSVNIASSQELRHPLVFVEAIFMNIHHDTLGPIAILDWNPIFQIPGDVLITEGLMTNHCQAPSPAMLISTEAVARMKVGNIVDEFIQRIGRTLQSRGYCKPITVREEAEDAPALSRFAIGFNQFQTAPEHGRSGFGRKLSAGILQGTSLTRRGGHPSNRWSPQRHPLLVNANRKGLFADIEMNLHRSFASHKANHLLTLLTKLLFDEWLQCFFQNAIRNLSSSPVGQAPGPFGQHQFS